MPLLTVPIAEVNDCHTPAGSPAGGQFCAGKGSATLTGVRMTGPREVHPEAGELPDDTWLLTTDQGWVQLSPSKHYMGPHLSVDRIAVRPELKGQGFGQALYFAAVKAAKVIGKETWPRYRGIFSSPSLRSPDASRAWEALKRKYPKKVKTVRTRRGTWEVLE